MKHLDALFDELQEPIAQLIDWCDDDKDRAVLACISDLLAANDGVIFDVIKEIIDDDDNCDLRVANDIVEISDYIYNYLFFGVKPDFDYNAFYGALEHIINDRIEAYNKS